MQLLTPQQLQGHPQFSGLAATAAGFLKTRRLCRAEAQPGLVCGTLALPAEGGQAGQFFYALQPGQLVLVDEGATARPLLQKLQAAPGPKRSPAALFCGLLELLVAGGPQELAKLENALVALEDQALSGPVKEFDHALIACRKRILALAHFYMQLEDMADILQENDNGFFAAEELRGFKLFGRRAGRLKEETYRLREYSTQVREVYQTQLDLRQNRIMKALTVVTTLCLPLSLLAGWYGMNFTYMPELHWRYGYPAVIAAGAAVVALSLWLMKKKKFW